MEEPMGLRSLLPLMAVMALVTLAGFSRGENLAGRVQAAGQSATRAYLAGDLDRWIGFYTPDAVQMPNYGPMWSGREAILAAARQAVQSGIKTLMVDYGSVRTWECGNLVYDLGTHTVTLQIPGHTKPVVDRGKYLNIWEKQPDGSLKIKLEIWNTDQMPGSGAPQGR